MKRFHVHLHVQDLPQSIHFYSNLFATQPARQESDYAKWMLEDPPVNFAISNRGQAQGIDHLGFQVDNEDELAELKARAAAADPQWRDEGKGTCCYARSEKHWVTDPQGIAWEHFHTLANIAVYFEAPALPALVAAPAVKAVAASCGAAAHAGPAAARCC